MRWWRPLLTIGLAAAGFLLGELLDRRSYWSADDSLFARLGVRPVALSPYQPDATRETAASGLRFESVEGSGLSFAYDNGPEGQYHLAETLGGGVGALDYDRDGSPDLVFIDGGDPVHWPENRTARLYLYRQEAGGRVRQVAPFSHLEWTGYGHGCAVADFNNDGFEDLLLTGYEQSALWINLGDGTFVEEPELRRLAGDRWCASACWSDLDGDGDLDVYITCYAVSPHSARAPVCESKGTRIHCNPHFYGRLPDVLLENTGDGTFGDRSQSSGIAAFEEYGLGVVAADFDRDGVTELFVANDGDRNLLFRRKSPWVYEDVAQGSGVAFNGQGETMGSMGIALADFDENGRLDLFTTNFSNESNALFRQVADLVFMDSSEGTVIDRASRALVGWSAVPLDGDCDGHLDLFIANGHVTRMPGEDWAQLPILMKGNNGDLQQAGTAGDWFEKHWHARGANRVDWNRDGLDDLVVSLIGSPAALLLNRAPRPGNRIQLELVGTRSPRSAEGALVEVERASGKSLHLVSVNGGYLSSNSTVQTIGMGSDAVIDRLRIQWPGGTETELRSVAPGTRLTVIEGRESPLNEAFRASE